MNYVLAFFFILTIVGCTPLEDPDTVQLNDKLFVKAGKKNMKANGKDTTYIVARIPVDAGMVDISFSASAGSFPKSGGQSISEFATLKDDTYRYATVLFQADSMPRDSVWITAEVTQSRNHCSLTFN
jgi:hypothetical protein